MNAVVNKYTEIEARFATWAKTRPDIRAAIVIGSRARQKHSADVWSDLDMVAFVTDPAPYLSDVKWIEDLGEIWFAFIESIHPAIPQWHILFAGMYDVEIAFIKLLGDHPADLRDAIKTGGLDRTVRWGMRVLIDKDGGLANLALPDWAPVSPPSQDEFLEIISKFWINVERSTKKLQRGEVYITKQRINCTMNSLLMQMAVWHAHTQRGWDYDTWYEEYGGRFVENWADTRVIEGLRVTSAQYDVVDIKRTLLSMMDLFSQLAVETAESLRYSYPAEIIARTADWVKTSLLK